VCAHCYSVECIALTVVADVERRLQHTCTHSNSSNFCLGTPADCTSTFVLCSSRIMASAACANRSVDHLVSELQLPDNQVRCAHKLCNVVIWDSLALNPTAVERVDSFGNRLRHSALAVCRVEL
jgi:hypothetical protein